MTACMGLSHTHVVLRCAEAALLVVRLLVLCGKLKGCCHLNAGRRTSIKKQGVQGERLFLKL